MSPTRRHKEQTVPEPPPATYYCPFDISWKDIFCLVFYFKWKSFVLTDHILSETICLFYFCVLFSNIYTKIKFTAKSWSDLWNFYSKVIFLEILSKKIFFTFLCWIWIIDVSQQYCENFRKIEQVELVENLAPSYLPYRFLHDLASFLLWEKVKLFDFFKNQWLEWNFSYIGSYDKWFCMKSRQKFANLLLLCKASSKQRLSERCRKHSRFLLFVWMLCPV